MYLLQKEFWPQKRIVYQPPNITLLLFVFRNWIDLIFPWAVRIYQESLAGFWDTLLILTLQKITQHLICFAIQCIHTFSSGTNIRLNATTAVNYWRSGPLHLYWWHNFIFQPCWTAQKSRTLFYSRVFLGENGCRQQPL